MMKHPHRKSGFRIRNLPKQLASVLRHWHRSLGIFSAIFILTMAVTGILINHSHDLSADTTKVKQTWLLDYYGIQPPSAIAIYQISPVSLASTDNLVWVDQKLGLEANATIKGMITFEGSLLVVDSYYLYVLSSDGELLEQQDASWGLPQGIEAIGRNENLWLKTSHGYYVSNHDLSAWHPQKPTSSITWSSEMTNPTQIEKAQATISLQARSSHLTWERVLLDVHSGRFFGKAGPWFMDFIAVALIIMVLSGMYLWWRKRRKFIQATIHEKNIQHFALEQDK